MRNLTIDAIKGLAVVLVIVGHAIQRSFPDYLNNTLFNIIYSFHMPLFMLLSGYVLYFSKKSIDMKWLGNKFRQLLIPFFAWYIIYWVANDFSFTGLSPYLNYSGTFIDYLIRGIKSPGNGPWFLWAILICFVSFYFSHKLFPRFGVFYAVVIIYLLGRAIPTNSYGLEYIKSMFPFFAFGYIFANYKEKLVKYHKLFLILSLVLFPFLSISWFSDFYLPHKLRYVASILKIVIPLMGILLSYHLILILKKTSVFPALTYIGTISLEMYLCQGLFLNVGIGDGYQRVITIMIAATSLSCLLTISINKIDGLRRVLLGK